MRIFVRRILAAIEIARLSVAFGAVANVWLMILLARGDERLAELPIATRPLWQVLAAGAMVAIGFLAFGAALNDLLDAKHDRAFAPQRPLPAGSLPPRRAMQIAAIALCTGLLGALAFGNAAVIAGFGVAATALIYDAFAKHVPAIGILLAGAATALSMLVPRVDTPTLAPVWLAMSQTMGIGLLAYILGEKRPKLSTRSIAAGTVAWLAASAGLFALEASHNGGEVCVGFPATQLAIPAAAVVLGGIAGSWKLRKARGPRANDRILRYGSLWKSLVAAAWLFAAGMPREGAWIAGIAVALFALVAIVREAAPQIAEPVSWRS